MEAVQEVEKGEHTQGTRDHHAGTVHGNSERLLRRIWWFQLALVFA